MTNQTIKHILESHSIPFCEQDGRIYADSMETDVELFERVIDVTDYTKTQLYWWLGY